MGAASLNEADDGPPDVDDVYIEEAPEGEIIYRLHKTRERNPALVKSKKRQALKEHGTLECEVCGFDFRRGYGPLGSGFIECHHTVPVSRLSAGHKTVLSELALVCANCHRMLHRGGELLSVAELREVVKAIDPAG